MHELTREQARRVAVRAQLLEADLPPGADDVESVIAHLTLVQYDQTAAVAPNADLVLWSRLGHDYRPEELTDLLEQQRLVELHSFLRPAADIRLYRADMAAWPGADATSYDQAVADWVRANDACRLDVLDRLRREGPLPMSELPDTCVRSWRSSGWNNHQNLRMLLIQLVDRGEVAIAGREGREKLFDLAERVYPDDDPLPVAEARAERDRRRLRSLGIARAKAAKMPGEPNGVGEVGEPARVEGLRGAWRVDPAYLDDGDLSGFAGRTALLSPLDRLVMDRKRMEELFEFDYQLEMYKPAAKRRWGYYALPVLHGDRLIGKLDATAERAEGVLRIDAVHEDEPWPDDVRDAVEAEIEALARFLGLEPMRSRERDG